MGINKYFVIVILLLGLSSQTQARVRVIFDGINLYVPEKIKALLKVSKPKSALQITYHINNKNKYVDISHSYDIYDGFCSDQQFFDAITAPITRYTCGKRETDDFLAIYGKGAVWVNPQNQKKYYFFINKERRLTEVYIPASKGKPTYFIQSNFLTIEQMQQLFIKPDE